MSAIAPIRDRLSWEVTPELYARIRGLWIDHSKAENRRDLGGLIATLAEDCVYESCRRASAGRPTTAHGPST